MPKKLMPTNPGAKKVGAGSLRKAGGSNRPMDGSGARGTSKPKLKPNNMGKKMSIKGGGSNRPMDGNRGPKSTG